MLSGGSLGHPGILPWCPLRHRPPCCPQHPLAIPGSSCGVPSDTGPHAVRRIPWPFRDPPLVSPQTQAPMLSGGSLRHPGILPWCPLRHRLPSCPEDPLNIPGSQACQPLQFKTLETRWSKHCMLHRLGGCGPNGIIYRIILSS